MSRMKPYLSVLVATVMLFSVSVASAPHAQAKQGGEQKQEAGMVTASGRIVLVTVDGQPRYVLQDAAGKKLYYLEVGPPWYHKSVNQAYPLDKYANQQATVTGVVKQPKGPNNGKGKGVGRGNAKARPTTPTDAPTMDVHTINGEKLRGGGPPPWAGGPNNVPGHPGSQGKGHRKP